MDRGAEHARRVHLTAAGTGQGPPASQLATDPPVGPGRHGGVTARRFDWHVLLPRGQGANGHWLVLGGGRADLLALDRLGLAGLVTTSPDPSAPAAVVALLHGATTPLADAVASLAPGGVLYWEVDRRGTAGLFRSSRGLRRDLARAGLRAVASYWVGPGWSSPTRWLPLDRDGPIAWYLRTMGSTTGARTAILRRSAALALGRAPIARAIAPRIAVIATAGEGTASIMPAVLEDPAVRAGLGGLAVGLPVQMSGGQEDWSRITLLGFGPDRTGPTAVVKVARHHVFDGATRGEHECLLDVRARLPAALRATVPAPLAAGTAGPRAAIVQEAVPGTSALTRLTRPGGNRTALADLARTAAWVADVAVHLREGEATPGSDAWAQHIDRPLERVGAVLPVSAAVDRLLRRARDHLRAVARTVPLGITHMDLGPWNVLVQDDRIAVIDWEVARRGVPFTDLAYATMHWHLAMLGSADRDGVDDDARLTALLRRPSGEARESLRILGHHGAALGVDPVVQRALIVLMLAQQALDRDDRRRAAGAGPEPSPANRYVRYLEVLAAWDDGWPTGPSVMPLSRHPRR